MKVRGKKIISVLMVLLLTMTVLSGCIRVKDEYKDNDSKEEQNTNDTVGFHYPLTVKDGFDNEVTFEKAPKRIVSLAPNNTEILFALGLGNRVVGVSKYSDYPEAAKDKETVGSYNSMNIEKIIELSPDLVVQYGEGKENINKQLKAAGIKILNYEPESIKEVMSTIESIGQVTNTMKKAKEITVVMQAKMDYIASEVKDAKKPKVFYEVWGDPLKTAGPGSFIDEIITLAGGENIAGDASGSYADYSVEKLVEKNPDIYIAPNSPGKTVESIKNNEQYKTLNAVKNDKIYLVDQNIISRAGPRIVDVLEMIAKKIHPELFKDTTKE
ncbi:ABC transporter substrate-binding protein [Dethiothermospora halolimnae]|uniref:ABC transporter substrate-binding protein n=1 Tax=Dethiothermospora halolimnae TaxID=3114390 RepID=UPI003CCBBCBD